MEGEATMGFKQMGGCFWPPGSFRIGAGTQSSQNGCLGLALLKEGIVPDPRVALPILPALELLSWKSVLLTPRTKSLPPCSAKLKQVERKGIHSSEFCKLRKSCQ